MNSFTTVDEILMFAINAEQEAADFYNRMSAQALNTEMKQVFKQYAYEEMGHKARLIIFREQGMIKITAKQIQNLKISDYITNTIPGPEMTYVDALALAMNKEFAAEKLYLDLASQTPDEEIKNALTLLAGEEAQHKLRFEIEYNHAIIRKI